jgi:hypothetical protein
LPNVLTPDDIESFELHLREWQTRFGLLDWRIFMSPLPAKKVMAQMENFDWQQRQVSCRLGHDWKSIKVTPITLEQTAVHELLHVLLYELIESAKNNQISDEDLGSVEHRIINILERLLVPGGAQ